MGQSTKEYVVIEFILTIEVATVHKSWIESSEKDKVKCYWPDRDQIKLAAKHVEPDKANWTKWDIRILSSSDDFQTARKMERNLQFTSGINSEQENFGKKQRIRKPSKKFIDMLLSGDSDDMPTPKKKKRLSYQKKYSSSSECDLPTPIKPPSTQKQSYKIPENTPILSSDSKRTLFSPCVLSLQTFTNLKDDILEPPQNLSLESNQLLLLDLKSKVDCIERSIQKIRYDVKEVLELIKGQQSVCEDIQTTEYVEFEKRFPLLSVIQVMEFESSLESEDITKMLVVLIKQIGGVSLEDSVRRVCVRLFTNEAASHFSWEGRKGKLCLNSLNLIKLIGRVLSNIYKDTFTLKTFEFRVREWFRQALTRSRAKKRIK